MIRFALLVVVALSAKAHAAPERVVIWHAYRAAEERALDECVRRYRALHPDVDVQLVAQPSSGFSDKLEAAIPHGNGPDLFIAGHNAIGRWADGGVIAPVDFDPAGFLPETLPPVERAGKRWAVPLVWKTLALFYRKDLVPRAPATLVEWQALARPGRFAMAYESGGMFYHAAFLHGLGGRVLDDRGRVHLDTPEGEAALTLVVDLQKRGVMPEETTSTVATQLFNDGRALTVMNGPWLVGELAPATPYAVAPLPTLPGGAHMKPFLTVEGMFLAARSLHPAAALDFARWLAGPEAALIRARVGRQTVTDAAAWTQPDVAGDAVFAAFRAQLSDTVPTPNAPEIESIWEPAQEALRKALRYAATPKEALHAAQFRAEVLLRPPPRARAPLPYAALALVVLLGALLFVRRELAAAGGWPAIARARRSYAWIAPAVAATAVLLFVPLLVGASMSLFHHAFKDGRHDYTFVGLSNFVDILAARDTRIWEPLSFYFTLAVTMLWTLVNVTLHVVIGVTLALLLRDPLLRLRGVYRVLLIVPWAMPSYITALMWKGMFHRQFGAINGILVWLGLEPVSWFSRFSTAFCANLVTNVWLGFPFMMVVTLGALARIPAELEDAATLDGASRWQRLRHVTLPLLWPTLLPSVILGAVWTFNMFNVVFLVSGGEPDGASEILVSQAYRWAFSRGHQYGYAAAYAVLIFALLWLQQRAARRLTRSDA